MKIRMKKSKHPIFYCLIVLFLGCEPPQPNVPVSVINIHYNKPFINIDETLLLKEGMTKDRVLLNVGEPLYVLSGNIENKSIKWIYEIRTIKVKSEIGNYGNIIPKKSNFDFIHSEPIHLLELEFQNNLLDNWQIKNRFDSSVEVLETIMTQPDNQSKQLRNDNSNNNPFWY